MPFARILSGALVGIESVLIEVEVNLDYKGFPSFAIVGLPSKEVDESKERVRSAIKNSGIKFPDAKITVNLAPADLPKRGALYDLPIALGILCASGNINVEVDKYFIFGELSLNGKINPVRGTISLLEFADKKYPYALIPKQNESESTFVQSIKVYPCEHLRQIISFLNGLEKIDAVYPQKISISNGHSEYPILKSIKGQNFAKRAIILAATGGHNISISGPPGTGKTLLCKALNELLPPMSDTEIFEISKINSVSSNLLSDLIIHRPFRSPHHSISRVGLIGGGNPIKPGEISLSHNGLLFLDEFPEFSPEFIESLRQSLESHEITISRSSGNATYPANFMLAVAYNLCPCGYYGHPTKECSCTPMAIKRYLSRISGPVIDRIDIHVRCLPVQMTGRSETYLSEDEINIMNHKIISARLLQNNRYINQKYNTNANASNELVLSNFNVSNDAKILLEDIDKKNLIISSRSYFKILKIARTIADYEGSEDILPDHIYEAIQYRELSN